MIAPNLFYAFVNNFFLIYAIGLFLSYVLIGILSTFELIFYIRKNRYFDYRSLLSFKRLPSISIVAPAFNEERTIIENIRSMLSLSYPNLEVIIVNDGSSDDSLLKIIQYYSLVKVDMAIDKVIPTQLIRGVYKSTRAFYRNLIVVDKVNGGKADALNAGINISRSDLFLSIDVDCILEPDAILRMVKPFLEEEGKKQVIASGGVIRVANSCEIKDGAIVKVNYPNNLWAKYQVLEYFRAFTLGRMAWSRINGLLIISGAFGLFNRKLVEDVGGYDSSTVGEDLELVTRMRRHMHEQNKKNYRVAFVPDPLCWTEVPSDIKVLARQRNRWTRGAIDTILKHKKMFFNPKYGRIGMLSFPYWVFFEWLAPIVEVVGVIYFIIMAIMGAINPMVYILLLLLVFSFSLAFSSFAVFNEFYVFSKYRGYKFLFQVFLTAATEIIIFHPLNVVFSISGNFDFFIRKNRKGWGVMPRKGFNPMTYTENRHDLQ